jgi:predicted transcriptional regulator
MAHQLYLEIGTGQQAKILKLIKEHSGLSWGKIAEILKVKKRMVFFYLKEKSRIPMHKLIELSKQTNFDLKKLEKLNTIKMPNFEQKEIRKPKLKSEFAEFLGALTGDGNIDPKNHRVCITCDAITDLGPKQQSISKTAACTARFTQKNLLIFWKHKVLQREIEKTELSFRKTSAKIMRSSVRL